MLTDPLAIKTLSLVAHTAITVLETQNFAVVDISPGKSVRVGSLTVANDILPAKLTISHSVSNENKPAKTNRTLVRFDIETVPDSSGRMMSCYAYAVIGIPVGGVTSDGATLISLAQYRQALVAALRGALGVSSSAATLDETKIDRVLAGEP